MVDQEAALRSRQFTGSSFGPSIRPPGREYRAGISLGDFALFQMKRRLADAPPPLELAVNRLF